jgi:hypothetical protein
VDSFLAIHADGTVTMFTGKVDLGTHHYQNVFARILGIPKEHAQGGVSAWETRAWLPVATANLPGVPLLAPDAAKIAQPQGRSTGLIHQNVDPPYTFPFRPERVKAALAAARS